MPQPTREGRMGHFLGTLSTPGSETWIRPPALNPWSCGGDSSQVPRDCTSGLFLQGILGVQRRQGRFGCVPLFCRSPVTWAALPPFHR